MNDTQCDNLYKFKLQANRILDLILKKKKQLLLEFVQAIGEEQDISIKLSRHCISFESIDVFHWFNVLRNKNFELGWLFDNNCKLLLSAMNSAIMYLLCSRHSYYTNVVFLLKSDHFNQLINEKQTTSCSTRERENIKCMWLSFERENTHDKWINGIKMALLFQFDNKNEIVSKNPHFCASSFTVSCKGMLKSISFRNLFLFQASATFV